MLPTVLKNLTDWGQPWDVLLLQEALKQNAAGDLEPDMTHFVAPGCGHWLAASQVPWSGRCPW